MKTVHDLVPDIFGEVVVAFHSELVLLEVIFDAFGDRQQALSVFAVRTVERKSFVHGLLLSFDLNSDAFLVEFVFGDTQIHIDQQEFIMFDESIVKGYLVVLQSYLTLLEEQLQIYTDQCRFLNLVCLIYVVLQDHFRFLPRPKQQNVV